MAYEVVISARSEADLLEVFAYIHARSPLNAGKWLRELHQSIEELSVFHGHAPARESHWLDHDLRQKIFKSHRIFYSVDDREARIYVHLVRHGAMRSLGEPPDSKD